jgi:hypothetical protein
VLFWRPVEWIQKHARRTSGGGLVGAWQLTGRGGVAADGVCMSLLWQTSKCIHTHACRTLDSMSPHPRATPEAEDSGCHQSVF